MTPPTPKRETMHAGSFDHTTGVWQVNAGQVRQWLLERGYRCAIAPDLGSLTIRHEWQTYSAPLLVFADEILTLGANGMSAQRHAAEDPQALSEPAPLVKTFVHPGRFWTRDVASLLIRQHMALIDEGIGPKPAHRTDATILQMAADFAGHLFTEHDLFDARLLPADKHKECDLCNSCWTPPSGVGKVHVSHRPDEDGPCVCGEVHLVRSTPRR